jgi:DNA polymerase delta subunit 1
MESKKRKEREDDEYDTHMEDKDESAGFVKGYDWSKMRRPTLDPVVKDVCFQNMQIDYIIGDRCRLTKIKGNGKVPVIRLYGVTKAGNSVQCNVHNYLPNFLIELPGPMTKEEQEDFLKRLNREMENNPSPWKEKRNFKGKKTERDDEDEEEKEDTIVSVEQKKGNSLLESDFRVEKDFLRINLISPKLVTTCRTLLHKRKYKSYESNIPFVLRFMVDIGLVGAGWLEIKENRYRRVIQGKTSTCQLEVDVSWEDIVTHKPDGEWSVHAPLRTLSFDIECAGRKGIFPVPDQDPVIQIANAVFVQGQEIPICKNVFNLKGCNKIFGSDVLCFKEEKELLLEWSRFIKEVDPDIIIGYNIANFDLPYLVNRSKALKIDYRFAQLGRIWKERAWLKDSTFSSKAYGTRESKECHMAGRVTLDILQVIQREHKLRSYTLNAVSARFIQDQKDDVPHDQISVLHNGTDADRKRLAEYCIKDALLPMKILNKLMIFYNSAEMARVTGVPYDFLMSKGQQVKVLSQILRKAGPLNRYFPFYEKEKSEGGKDEKGYQGATVLEPKPNFYNEIIVTLDFASLYPSLMISMNTCYSTFIQLCDLYKWKPEEWSRAESGHHFLRKEVFKGILPMILEDLLAKRKIAKADLKLEKDPFKAAVLDGRQLALKISANSVYGFTGATVGKLPCLEISSTVTAGGRKAIETARMVTERESKDYEVIYGDTDSIMARLRKKSMEETIIEAKRIAKLITAEVNSPPMEIIWEKCYDPYLLIGKKRYAGMYWTNSKKYDKMDAKGIENVRRDSCRWVSITIDQILHKILIDRDVEAAKDHVRRVVSDLLMNRVDTSLLVITKSLSKPVEQYATVQAHTALTLKMRERDFNSAPVTGDSVKYVMIQKDGKARKSDMAEDPIFALENDLPISTDYYLNDQLKRPVMRILEPVMKDEGAESLFQGEHMRERVVTLPSKGGIMDFAVKRAVCAYCKARLSDHNEALCQKCKDDGKGPKLYIEKTCQMRRLEERYSSYWTQCQMCQGSVIQPVICNNDECNIFYARRKAQKELSNISDLVKRFDLSW